LDLKALDPRVQKSEPEKHFHVCGLFRVATRCRNIPLKVQMNAGSDVIDLSVKKLAIGRMTIIVFDQ
jgi:hypothetical protein